jgi:small subunit ribosomal protein S6
MSLYESVIIARQEISTQQVEALADTFEGVIKDNGGSVEKRENWGLRSLAYKIKKNRKGHYLLFNIDAPADAVHELERLMRLNEDVLRYLTLRVDEFEEGPSIPAQNQARNDRPARSYDNNPSSNSAAPEKAKEETEEKAPVEAKEDVVEEAPKEDSEEAAPKVETKAEVEAESETKAEGEK